MLSCELPGAPELEESLQNGVILCKLGMKLLPDEPMWNKVYDLDQSKYKVGIHKYLDCHKSPLFYMLCGSMLSLIGACCRAWNYKRWLVWDSNNYGSP